MPILRVQHKASEIDADNICFSYRCVIGASNRQGHHGARLRAVAVLDGVGDRVGRCLARCQALEGVRRVGIVCDPCPRRTGERHCRTRARRGRHDFQCGAVIVAVDIAVVGKYVDQD